MKKLLKYSAISLLVIFVLLLIAPFIFKKQLIQAAKNFVNEQLVADVNFNEDETSVSFLRSFPNVSFAETVLLAIPLHISLNCAVHWTYNRCGETKRK
jgi:hypothetical protein